MASTEKKSGCGCFTLLGIIALIAGGGAYFYFKVFTGKELTPLQAAEVVPQEAMMTTFISTDPQAWSKLEKYKNLETQKLFDQNLKDLKSGLPEGNQINYEQDIQPWLGNVMLAYFPNNGKTSLKQDTNLLVIVGITNKLKALKFADKIKGQEGQKIQETKYEGITIWEATNKNQETMISAVIGEQFMFSSQKQLIEKAIDTHKGKPSFADNVEAKKILAKPLDLKNPLAQIYLVDFTQLSQQASDKNTPSKVAVESVVMGVGAEDQGLRLQMVANVDPQQFKQPFQATSGRVLSQLPADTLLLINGQGISQWWSQVVTQAKEYPELQIIVDNGRKMARQSFDLDLDRDILGWMDREFALGIFSSKQGALEDVGIGGAIILETGDRSTAEKTLNTLEKYNPPYFRIKENQVKGIPVKEWKTFQEKEVLTYGWLQKDSLLMTFGTPFITVSNTNSGTSLAESERFKTLTKSLPTKNLGYVYLDIEKALAILQESPQPPQQFLPPEANTILTSIQGIVATATIPNPSTSQLDIMVSLKEQQK